MLWGGGFMGGNNTVSYCRSYNFNPACDRPAQLSWRPETTLAQMIGMKMVNIAGLRGYNFAQNMPVLYSNTCCGWQTAGTGTGAGINPWNDPKQWAAMARVDAELTLDTRWELQPEGNKPYYGPMFLTDVHLSATYGNYTQIQCESETTYGSFTVNTNAISGGTLLERILTPYSLITTVVGGNPSTATAEWCATAGQVTTFIALPAGVAIMDTQTFTPPSPLPYGASHMLVWDGAYLNDFKQERVTDCTSGCSIAFDHHNIAWSYRVDYVDANYLPKSIGTPVTIPSQGSY